MLNISGKIVKSLIRVVLQALCNVFLILSAHE